MSEQYIYTNSNEQSMFMFREYYQYNKSTYKNCAPHSHTMASSYKTTTAYQCKALQLHDKKQDAVGFPVSLSYCVSDHRGQRKEVSFFQFISQTKLSQKTQSYLQRAWMTHVKGLLVANCNKWNTLSISISSMSSKILRTVNLNKTSLITFTRVSAL